MKPVTTVLVAIALALFAGPAAAQAKNGDPITTSDYTLDLYEGPVLAGSRVIGLGGAYVAVADGIAGANVNPAAVAYRVPWSVDWFDWDLDGGVTLPSSITENDFDNNGQAGFANSAQVFLTGGAAVLVGALGAGISVDVERYRVESRDPATKGQPIDVGITRGLFVAGYGLFHGQLVGGLGLSASNVEIDAVTSSTASTKLASITGLALHLGLLWAPYPLPLRIGASVRLAPTAEMTGDSRPEGATETSPGVFTAGGYVVPRTVSLPTEARLGIAWQFFRPLNFAWVNPHDEAGATRRVDAEIAAATERRRKSQALRRERANAGDGGPTAAGQDVKALEAAFRREDEGAAKEAAVRRAAAKKEDRARRLAPYRAMPREKLLVSVEVKMTTIATDGVGVESFLLQKVERSGEEVAFSPRLGLEGEVIPGWLVLRGGAYYEPTRFSSSPGASPRVHGTGGLDVRIPITWSVFGLLEDDNTFRVGGAVDGASRYFGWAVSAGIWH